MSNKNINRSDRVILEDEHINDDQNNKTFAGDPLVSTDGSIIEDPNSHPSTHISDQLVSTDGHIVTDDDLGISDKERIIADNARRTADPEVVNRKVVTNDRDNIDRTEVKNMSKETKKDLNADPITGKPGSHPVGTGVGGVGGAAAGAAIGTMAGPLGTLIGGAIGAVVGGGAGHAAAEAIDPTREEAYWRAEHANTSYYQQGHDFERDLHPAYAVGYANRARYPADARFEDHEHDLRRSWEEVKGDSRLAWDDARLASRDAWNRVS